MREPKYQAWLGDVMVQVTSINMMKYPNGEYARSSRGYFLDGENKGSSIDFDLNKAELREYTGLKDKNGVEIYEGDIVKVKYSYEQNYLGGYAHEEVIGQVEYKHGCFDVYKNNVDQGIVIREHISDLVTEWKVIGNIYENPELLQN